MIKTDVINSDIPLLLSQASMKWANMNLNFKDDTASVFGKTIELVVTKSDHYAIPLTVSCQIIHSRNANVNVTLTVQTTLDKKKMAQKLHRQFAHASSEKLLRLVNSAGSTWSQDSKLKEKIKLICKNCPVCLIQKSTPWPIVGLPLVTKFKECVATDLKFYKGKILLHMIDHATRLSVTVILPSKKPDQIMNAIMKYWVAVYGTVNKFLTENRGEFVNEEIMTMCEALNIKVHIPGVESPWSNGIIEQPDLVLSEMLNKVLEEDHCSLDIALAWCLNAKNTWHGFSPFQLEIGQNPWLPCAFTDKPPLILMTKHSKIISDHLNIIHKAQEAFIMNKNSEKIRRALRQNIHIFFSIIIWTSQISLPECLYFPSYLVKHIFCFMLRYLMMPWNYKIWKHKQGSNYRQRFRETFQQLEGMGECFKPPLGVWGQNAIQMHENSVQFNTFWNKI